MNIAFVYVSIILFTCIHFIKNFAGDSSIVYEWILIIIVLIMIFGGFLDNFIFSMIIQHIKNIVQNRTTIKRKNTKFLIEEL